MLDVRKLRLLAELEARGTIAAVAQAMHVTAPGVSMQLASLENELGLALTERRGRLVILTPAGQLLAKRARGLVDALAVTEMEVQALREGAAGTYRVAAFPSVARTIVADAWRYLLHNDTGIRLELVEMEPEDGIPALVAGDVDLALTHSYSNMPGSLAETLSVTRIATEPVWLACPRDGAPDGTLVDLASLGDTDWVVPNRRWSCYEMVQRACGAAGFVPRVVAEATDFSVLLALVSAGAGVALMPQLTIATFPDDVVLRELAQPVWRHDFLVSRSSSAADPGLARLAEIIADSARRLTEPSVVGEPRR